MVSPLGINVPRWAHRLKPAGIGLQALRCARLGYLVISHSTSRNNSIGGIAIPHPTSAKAPDRPHQPTAGWATSGGHGVARRQIGNSKKFALH